MSAKDRGRKLAFVPYRPALSGQNLDVLRGHLADAESGRTTAFAIASIGPPYTTHRTWSGGMTRAERINLIGQLQLLIAEISREELDNDV